MKDSLHVMLQVLDDIVPSQEPDAMHDGEADLSKPLAKQKLLYCERFVEFLTDLLSQLPTRRFIRTLLEDRAILTKCCMSALFQNPQGRLKTLLSRPIVDALGAMQIHSCQA